MSLSPHLEAARGLKVAWDDRRALSVERGIKKKQVHRRVATGTGLAVLLVALSIRVAPRPDVTVAPFNARADVRVLPQENRVEVAQLAAGGAWFDVRPNPNRTFRVEAGDVVVEVLGTRFAVERTEHNVRVLVDHGRVRVKWKGGERMLTNGMESTFPLHASETILEEAHPSTSLGMNGAAASTSLGMNGAAASTSLGMNGAAASTSLGMNGAAPVVLKPLRAPVVPAAPSWQDLARAGDNDAAFVALQNSKPQDVAEELLLAADVARLTRHPEQAVEPLNRLLARFPEDGRAPLAAFTLGRILLDQLAQPRAAAEAFGRARSLEPNGPLAEDALARQVGAAALAGDRAEATRLATEYLALFPDGRSVRAVKHHGGLE